MLVSTLTHAPGALLHMQVRSLGGGCCHHISSILASEVTGTATGLLVSQTHGPHL